ncbi:MAG: hypothetical protein JJ714_02080, partial [Acidithiobacillus sp.]|nr:hypothetical protein [Acidithiobacillus sp.]
GLGEPEATANNAESGTDNEAERGGRRRRRGGRRARARRQHSGEASTALDARGSDEDAEPEEMADTIPPAVEGGMVDEELRYPGAVPAADDWHRMMVPASALAATKSNAETPAQAASTEAIVEPALDSPSSVESETSVEMAASAPDLGVADVSGLADSSVPELVSANEEPADFVPKGQGDLLEGG